MTKFKSQGFNNTFKNARKGFRLVLKSELNIRVHVAVATLVLFAALLFKFSALEFCIVLFVIGLVIVAEMLNTAIEFNISQQIFPNGRNGEGYFCRSCNVCYNY